MLELNQNLGIAGEFQVIVRRADGSVRIDTGMQKNLILDNGLKYLLGQKMTNDAGEEEEEVPHSMFSWLVVGSGNQEPTNTDVKLQKFVARATSDDEESGRTVPSKDQHPNFIKLWQRNKFTFRNINNQNISELGLAVKYWYKYNFEAQTAEYRYLLATRTLIKGNDGRPLTITALEGEVLEVIYQVNMYVDIRRQTGEFKLTTYPTGQNPETGVGVESTFEYFLQPRQFVGGKILGFKLTASPFNDSSVVYSHGVKETDDELTADYDLTQGGYQFGYDDIDWIEFAKLVSTSKVTGTKNSGKYDENYQIAEIVSTDISTGKQINKIKTGIYSHIHDNGVRSFYYELPNVGVLGIPLVTGHVVLKNKANGQGIKKTNRQIWEFLISWTIKRWEG